MTTAAMSAAHLLQVPEAEFDTAVQKMTLKDLLEMITILQREMTREQENFNSLSVDLASVKKNSGQYKSVSKDMSASQTRLTLLMNRSMKCFSQQANQQGRRNSQGSSGVRLQRSNSAHEKLETAQAAKSSADKPDRNSVPVNIVSHDKLSVKPKPLVNGDKVVYKTDTHSSVFQIKPLKPVSNHSNQMNRTSLEVKSSKADTKTIHEPVQSSFVDARNKIGGVISQNRNFSTQLNVSSNVNRSQTFAGVDTKKVSNGVPSESNISGGDSWKETINVKDTAKSDNAPTVNGSHSVVKESVNVSVTSNANRLGPMAWQKKISTSMGSLQDIDKPKPEVVKGIQPTKPKSILVMSQDKQLMDLDSFTTRKTMLDEIKKFDKELKHTKTKDGRETKLTEIGSSSGGFYKVAERKSPEPDSRNKLMGDIKLSKKPSEIKSTKEEKTVNKDVKLETNNSGEKDTKHSKFTVDVRSTKEQIHPEAVSGNKNTPNIEINVSTDKDTASQMQKFDDLLNTVEDEDKSEGVKQDEELPVVSVIDVPRDRVTEKGDAATVGQISNTSESSADDTSDVSEDERFVTEFKFQQPEVKEQNKPHKKDIISRMADFEAQFAASLDSVLGTQPTDILNERLQRIQQLEKTRQERIRQQNPDTPTDPESRMSMRDRIIQQSQHQRRNTSTRRARHMPVRSASFHTGDTHVDVANEIQNFREEFEAARSNMFGMRSAGSSENLSGSQVLRRALDVPANQEGSLPTSGSSTPRISRLEEYDPAIALEKTFSSALEEMGYGSNSGFGSNSNLSDSGRGSGSRSSSATREGRNNSNTYYPRYAVTNPADITAASRTDRRGRLTERRRQTVGVTTSDVIEARGRTTNGFHASRTTDTNGSVVARNNVSSSRETLPSSSYRSSYYNRKIEINEELTRPVLSETRAREKVAYIDDKGHCHWLEKNHPILRASKDRTPPSITIKYKDDTPGSSNNSVIDIPGDPLERYNKLRELIMTSKSREGSCGNGDGEQSSNGRNGFKESRRNSFKENGRNGLKEREEIKGSDETDSCEKNKFSGIDADYSIEAIDRRFKHVSYYTKPRQRPSLDSYKLTRKYKSIYEYCGDDLNINENEENTERSPVRLASASSSSEIVRPNSLHITVTDTAEPNSSVQPMETNSSVGTNDTESTVNREVNPAQSLATVDSGFRSDSVFLRRAQSVQESRPIFYEPESPTSRLVRHGSLEAFNHRHSDVHEEVDTFINRLQQRHAYAEIPIDTSHLDIEEMRMIQKALEENPSPPPSPMETETLELIDNIEVFTTNETVDQSDNGIEIVVEPIVDLDTTDSVLIQEEPGPLSPVHEDIAGEVGPHSPVHEHTSGEVGPLSPVNEDTAGEVGPLSPVNEVTAGEVGPLSPVNEDTAGEAGLLSPVQEDTAGEVGPLSPVQEGTAETEQEAETDQTDSVHDVFNEFVSTVNEERILNLPRGYIFSNS